MLCIVNVAGLEGLPVPPGEVPELRAPPLARWLPDVIMIMMMPIMILLLLPIVIIMILLRILLSCYHGDNTYDIVIL